MSYIENSYTIFANVIRTYKVPRIFPGQLELWTNDNRSQALFWQMKDWYINVPINIFGRLPSIKVSVFYATVYNNVGYSSKN